MATVRAWACIIFVFVIDNGSFHHLDRYHSFGGIGIYYPFAWNYKEELAFFHHTPHPTIWVEFQVPDFSPHHPMSFMIYDIDHAPLSQDLYSQLFKGSQ